MIPTNNINLGIGEMIVARTPTIITTILGSCVSVCLYCEKARVGGLTHYALPDRNSAKGSQRGDMNFGDRAIEKLLSELLAIPGVERKSIRAKIVGGGKVISEISMSSNLGDLNIEMARKTLKSLGITVVNEHVGGKFGRKIFFYTDSGRLRVSFLTNELQKAEKIKLLIVDDSKTMRDLLERTFSSDEIQVVGKAASAKEAEPLLRSLKPDVITLDINMPGMDGVSFLKSYIPHFPIPTIMISSVSTQESNLVFEALECGAVDYIQKPSLDEIKDQRDFMREKIMIASKIKVKKQILKKSFTGAKISYSSRSAQDRIVAIGSSTGGTEALKEVLMGLPANIPPIVIVQHIPPIFSLAFARRLNELCPFEVIEGSNGDLVIPGRVIIAPGGKQMELIKTGQSYSVRIFDGEKVNRHRPSVDVLFNSAAKLLGRDAIGVILTGMGNDGAEGLLRMNKNGAHTIGQDQNSSIVYGMPKAAFELKAVTQVCPLSEVARAIIANLEKSKAA